MSREPLEPQDGNPIMGLRPQKLHDVKFSDLAIRFAFGAGVSTVAAVAGRSFGPVVGGMFLAFPAILPASLTLLWGGRALRQAPEEQLVMVLGGTGVRIVTVLLASWVLFARVPYYQAYPGFWGWVVVVYLFTLGLEMVLLRGG